MNLIELLAQLRTKIILGNNKFEINSARSPLQVQECYKKRKAVRRWNEAWVCGLGFQCRAFTKFQNRFSHLLWNGSIVLTCCL